MVRVINICSNDYANFSYTNAEALQSVGVDATSFILSNHPYNYSKQSQLLTRVEMRKKIRSADIIQIMHSDIKMLPLLDNINKKLIVYHTGTKYRQDPVTYNQAFNPLVQKSVIALGEFAGQGSKNEHYLVGAIDTDHIQPVYTCGYKWRKIRHHPSNAGTKGTAIIAALIQSLPPEQLAKTQFKYTDNKGRVNAQMNLKRMADCDVYVELFKLKQREKDYGSFGISALEAAALGKVVVTNNLWQSVYEREYGQCMLQIANTREAFLELIKKLIDMPDRDLLKMQHATRQWIEDKHSLQATGQRIKELILDV